MQIPGGPYFGKVTRVTADGAYVVCPQLAGQSELGPMQMLLNFRISDQQCAGLVAGDEVAVGCLDNHKDKTFIMGVLVIPTAPIAAPAANADWPGW